MNYNDYLMHHGILGMKWGIRRYQNKDGSLTPEGEKRYLDSYGNINARGYKKFYKNGIITKRGKALKEYTIRAAEEIKKQYVNADGTLNDAGKKLYREIYGAMPDRSSAVRSMKKWGSEYGVEPGETSDTIKKGSVLQRVANDEELGSTRKYMSIFPTDNENYVNEYEYLPIDFGKNVYKYDYTAVRDMKVAKGQEVMQYMVNRYGDVKMKDLYDDYNVSRGRNITTTYSYMAKDVKLRWMAEHKEQVESIMTRFAGDHMGNSYNNGKSSSEVIDYFAKKGYDAMVDPEDATHYQYPLIVFSPSKTTKITKKTQLN